MFPMYQSLLLLFVLFLLWIRPSNWRILLVLAIAPLPVYVFAKIGFFAGDIMIGAVIIAFAVHEWFRAAKVSGIQPVPTLPRKSTPSAVPASDELKFNVK